MTRPRRIATAPLALLGLIALAADADAAPRPAATRLSYAVTLAGLPIVTADLEVTDGAGRYALALDWRTTGLADLFAGAHGDVRAGGRLSGDRVVPERYRLGGTTGHKIGRAHV